jgi:hypothetical protein
MLKSSVAFLFCLVSTIVNAQTSLIASQKSVLCGSNEDILAVLASPDVDEKPIWIGRRDDGKTDFVVFLNFRTSAFTILEMSQNATCVLGIGMKSEVLSPPPNTKSSLPIGTQ